MHQQPGQCRKTCGPLGLMWAGKGACLRGRSGQAVEHLFFSFFKLTVPLCRIIVVIHVD